MFVCRPLLSASFTTNGLFFVILSRPPMWRGRELHPTRHLRLLCFNDRFYRFFLSKCGIASLQDHNINIMNEKKIKLNIVLIITFNCLFGHSYLRFRREYLFHRKIANATGTFTLRPPYRAVFPCTIMLQQTISHVKLNIKIITYQRTYFLKDKA